jgi:hypothetical protein
MWKDTVPVYFFYTAGIYLLQPTFTKSMICQCIGARIWCVDWSYLG